ncbi:MAG TPA: hypothetical protein VIA18_28440 [Polyangia bacterium]|jgi:hypothetical protein|nr:hypothetical protein [Polyangia bacterium]HWE28617.1 hypothetical protein [Polyangia bacterium]
MRALLVAVALLAVGCREGNTLENSGSGSISSTDVDMAKGGSHASPDLAEAPADMVAVETCGTILACGISCLSSAAGGDAGAGGLGGLGGLAGCTSCLQGAPPDATSEAEAIISCAVQNCLSDITGGGGIAGIFGCLTTSCSTQLGQCQGLGAGLGF